MSNPYSTPISDLMDHNDWKRSKWLTGWLWFMLITTVINLPIPYLMAGAILQQLPKATMPIVYAMTVLSAVNVLSIIGLLRHKRIGFWGVSFVVSGFFIINAYTVDFAASFFGLIGYAILVLLLFKGGSNSAWSRLR